MSKRAARSLIRQVTDDFRDLKSSQIALWPSRAEVDSFIDRDTWLESPSGEYRTLISRVRFREFPIALDCLLESNCSFPVEIAGIRHLALFAPRAPRRLSEMIDPDPAGSISLRMVSMPDVIECNTLFLVRQVAGGDHEAKLAHQEIAYDVAEFGRVFEEWVSAVAPHQPPLNVLQTERLDALIADKDRGIPFDVPPIREPVAVALETLTIPEPIEKPHLAELLALAANEHRPELSWTMLRLAQESFRLKNYRLAATEAGISVEFALAQLLERANLLPAEKVRKLTLGALIRKMDDLGVSLPGGHTSFELQESVVNPRNDAVHRGLSSMESAQKMLDVVESIVEEVWPLPQAAAGS